MTSALSAANGRFDVSTFDVVVVVALLLLLLWLLLILVVLVMVLAQTWRREMKHAVLGDKLFFVVVIDVDVADVDVDVDVVIS